METTQYWIDQLNLLPHPEGGYYKEVYRSSESVLPEALPKRFHGTRCFATSIYFLLEEGNFSAFHKIKADETWYYHAGGSLDIYMLSKGALKKVTIGKNLELGQQLQYTVPANTWFASEISPSSDPAYCLAGCAVAPGFDFEDFEMAKRADLLNEFPESEEIIRKLAYK